MAPHVRFGNQVALKEAFRKQQKVSALMVCLLAEPLDAAYGRTHIAEDLWRLARPDPRGSAEDPVSITKDGASPSYFAGTVFLWVPGGMTAKDQLHY
jgi:hypothetical protein